MRLLPGDQKKKVEDLIEKNQLSLDLYDVLGFCTWGRAKPEEPEAPIEEAKEEAKEEVKEEAPTEDVKEEVKAE